jgi:hypothetical protein
MGDVDIVIEHSARDIAAGEQVEGLSREASDVSSYDGGSEEAEVLEAILLSTLGAVDHCLSLKTSLAWTASRDVETYSIIQGLILRYTFGIGSRSSHVDRLAETQRIGMRSDGQDPGNWDLTKG